MQLTAQHKEYWRRNLDSPGVLLAIWFVVTYVMAWYARPLAEINFFGWPLSFYMRRRSLIIYVVLIYVYAKKMRKLDLEYNVEEETNNGRDHTLALIAPSSTSCASTTPGTRVASSYSCSCWPLPSKWACRGSTSATRSCSPPLPCTQALGL